MFQVLDSIAFHYFIKGLISCDFNVSFLLGVLQSVHAFKWDP